MKNTKKKLKGQSRVVKYSGFSTVAKYMNKQGIVKSISTLFPTKWHSATKFGVYPVKSALQNSLFNRVNQIFKFNLIF
jgi:hypothetical protein